MNILFLSLALINSFSDRGIYSDLARELIKNGHNVFYVCATERRNKKKTTLKTDDYKSFLLTVKTLNIQKTNIFEKGLGTILITNQFKKAIKKFFKGIKFDLLLYPTPPITLYGVVKCFKKRDNAKTYLMLKDIFPQNAVDLGLMKTAGIKGLIYKYFRKQEKKLYTISDRIGCMSPANVEYVLKHNPEISKEKVEVFPNCIEVQDISLTDEEKKQIREKYNLPLDKKIFVYGVNLGKPQDIPFIIDCLKVERENEKAFFLIIGDGTEFKKLEQYATESKQENFLLLKRLPIDEFDRVLASCDVGLIFLNHRFTIPNFPSRLLSYMQAGLPVLACTDVVSDVGTIICKENFGWFSRSDATKDFDEKINLIEGENIKQKSCNSVNYLKKTYDVRIILNLIFKKRN